MSESAKNLATRIKAYAQDRRQQLWADELPISIISDFIDAELTKARTATINEIADKIYAMTWLGEDEKRDYWRNLIAWNVRVMAQTADVPQAEVQK